MHKSFMFSFSSPKKIWMTQPPKFHPKKHQECCPVGCAWRCHRWWMVPSQPPPPSGNWPPPWRMRRWTGHPWPFLVGCRPQVWQWWRGETLKWTIHTCILMIPDVHMYVHINILYIHVSAMMPVSILLYAIIDIYRRLYHFYHICVFYILQERLIQSI